MKQPKAPGIVRSAFVPVNNHLGPKSRVFEWGSGHSTIYFHHVAGEIVTVEHSARYYARILRMLRDDGLPTDGVKLIEPDEDNKSTCLSSKVDGSFEEYVNAINEYPDLYFDLVLVDGCARRHCILAAITKVRAGGLMVIDNSERERYQEAISFLSGWDGRRYTGTGFHFGGRWETGVWRRP